MCLGCDPYSGFAAPGEQVAGPGSEQSACPGPARATVEEPALAKPAASAEKRVRSRTKTAGSQPADPKVCPGTGTEPCAAVASGLAAAETAARRALVQKVLQHRGETPSLAHYIYLPVYVNHLPVKRGEVLRLPCAPETKPKRAQEVITVTQTVKKMRL